MGGTAVITSLEEVLRCARNVAASDGHDPLFIADLQRALRDYDAQTGTLFDGSRGTWVEEDTSTPEQLYGSLLPLDESLESRKAPE
jgi:hypothetical protein